MSKGNTVSGKWPVWLNLRLLRYGAAALVIVAVFVTALSIVVNVMGRSRMETICTRLSERNTDAYTDRKTHIDHTLALETGHMREQLKMLAVLIRIHVMSREEFRFSMMRRFRHELKAMFERRGIQIPYTQIVLRNVADDTKAEAADCSAAGNTHTQE